MKDNFWDKRSEKYEVGLSENYNVVLKTLEWIKDYLSNKDNILDFGCATGEYSLSIANHVNSIVGIDTSNKMIEIANQKKNSKTAKNVSFKVADINSIKTETNGYSVILALSVLHLTENIAVNLQKLNIILKENGYLISVTPCLKKRSIFFRVLIFVLQNIGVLPKIQSISFCQLTSLFKENGFSIEEAKVLDPKEALYWIVGKKVATSF